LKTLHLNDSEIEFLLKCGNSSIVKKLSKPKMKTSSAKAKGRSFQYWVCEQIGNMFGVKFIQGDDLCPIHSREMGQHGKDLILREPIYSKFPFDIECKNSESLNVTDAFQQAKCNTSPGRVTLLVWKCKRITNPLVVMEWNAFERMVKDGFSNSTNSKT
jgi:hypothetical protein